MSEVSSFPLGVDEAIDLLIQQAVLYCLSVPIVNNTATMREDHKTEHQAWKDVPRIKNRTGIETSLAVQRIGSIAYKEGLQYDQIERLVGIATSGKFAESVSSKLVQFLIPKTSVPVSAVVKAISRICTNKLSINFQGLLIRWIVIVYNLIDNPRHLHSLYGIIFLFLESDILCPHVCHLLYYLTRKEDVKHFRIRKLLDLQKRTGSKPHLVALLSLYKIQCPNLISMATSVSSKKIWFKLYDKSWRESIRKVQEKYNTHSPLGGVYLTVRNTERVSDTPKDRHLLKIIILMSINNCLPKMTKRRKTGRSSIPTVQTAMTPVKRISIEQISSFKELLDNIDNVEFPSQVASVLDSPLLQHVISCNPDLVTLQRLNFWLNHSLYEEFLTGASSELDSCCVRLLQKLKQFTSFLQESIPAVEAFLVRYLFSWNGLDFRPLVLQFITYFGLSPFPKLNDLVLEPLRRLFFSSQVYIKCQILYCFTEMLRHFLAVELPRQHELRQEEQIPQRREMSSVSLFVEDDAEHFDPLSTIYELIQFIDRICVVALQVEQDHALLQHWVLNFFELVSTSHQQFGLPFVLIPSSGIIYRMLFSSNSMALSRLCQIIVNYKKEFESLKKSQSESENTPLSFPDGFQSIERFNHYILDICDSLWRNKAFVDRGNSLCFSMPSSVTDSLSVRHINESFSIHHHMSLVGEAWNFLHQTQPSGLKLTPSLIKGRSRRAYMEFLKQRNIKEVLVFLETFIKPRS